MNKLSTLKKKKLLKDKRRTKKIKKQTNYLSKTHKGTDKFYLQENLNKEEGDYMRLKWGEEKIKGLSVDGNQNLPAIPD